MVESGDPNFYYIHIVWHFGLRYSLFGLPPRPVHHASLVAGLKEDVAIEEQGSLSDGSSNKRYEQKNIHHAFEWEMLDNHDVSGIGLDNKKEEHWPSLTCKKYVKMYHIDKLWPRECHEVHTKNFACKP